MTNLRLAALWIGTVALFVFLFPLCVFLTIWEAFAGKESPYWPFERGQE